MSDSQVACSHSDIRARVVTGVIPVFSRKLCQLRPETYKPMIALIRCPHDGGSVTTHRALSEG